jgi:peptide-methionine (S)-S-oxide reductase
MTSVHGSLLSVGIVMLMFAASDGCKGTRQAGSGRSTTTAAPAASEPATGSATKGVTAMQTQEAMFGAGCFWGVELTFQKVEGVVETAVGYSGGYKEHPTYKEVCADKTGHAEVVHVKYDPSKVSYADLLQVFWRAHDPTQVNRQGPDFGSQYRSAIFVYDDEQAEIAQRSKDAIQEQFSKPIATSIEPAQTFWRAEDYHQKYLEKRGADTCATGGH